MTNDQEESNQVDQDPPQMQVPYEKHHNQSRNDPDEGSTLTWRDFL